MEQVIIPEKVKAPFDYFLIANRLSESFKFLPFMAQSGVYTAFLRSRKIHIRMLEDEVYGLETVYMGRVKYNLTGRNASNWIPDYNSALIQALNEGFKLLEEQLSESKKALL